MQKKEKSQDLHVVPLYDLREHQVDAGCWCNPELSDAIPDLWIHKSADGREDYESGIRKPH